MREGFVCSPLKLADGTLHQANFRFTKSTAPSNRNEGKGGARERSPIRFLANSRQSSYYDLSIRSFTFGGTTRPIVDNRRSRLAVRAFQDFEVCSAATAV